MIGHGKGLPLYLSRRSATVSRNSSVVQSLGYLRLKFRYLFENDIICTSTKFLRQSLVVVEVNKMVKPYP